MPIKINLIEAARAFYAQFEPWDDYTQVTMQL